MMDRTDAVPVATAEAERGEMAISVEDVRKSYGSIRAVDGLSFEVRRGEIFALLGPNGAGKTTMVEILEGYRRPDAGTVRVLGFDPVRHGRDMREQIGLMLQQTALYERIKVGEAVDLFCSYYRRPADPAELIRLVGLEHQIGSFFGNLSGGQKQRLSLALALAGNPQVAFLDEPTAAMDPQARLQTWEIIDRLRQQRVTVLLTTHYMEEAQRLADHVAIIDHGKLVAFGTPAELMSGASAEVVTFTVTPPIEDGTLHTLPGVTSARSARAGEHLLTTSNALDTIEALAAWRHRTGTEISDLRVTGATLEDVFLQLTGEAVRD